MSTEESTDPESFTAALAGSVTGVGLVWAQTPDGVIGKDGDMPWNLPEDLKHFSRLTMGHPVIMGRKTYESIGRLLPGRTTIIVTRQSDYRVPGAIVAHSLDEAIARCRNEEEIFVIGGGELYRETLPRADRIYLTTVEAEPPGDTFMPEIDWSAWRETSAESFGTDEKHAYPYRFAVYDRK